MHNFPKLSSTFQDSQFSSEHSKNQSQFIQQSESRKITTASQGRNLSPFTWNNIKLPAVLIKEKLQKGSKMKQKEETNQLMTKKPLSKNEFIEQTKLQTIGQKAKKALNISVQLRKMLPQKASPIKNLHQKVLVEYQKRKLTTGIKMRQNRSLTQKQGKKMLGKAYETMQIKTKDKSEMRLVDSNLLRTQQRYRNSRSTYEQSEFVKGDMKKKIERYAKNDTVEYDKKESTGKKDVASFRAKYRQYRHEANDKQLFESLNSSVIIKSSCNSPSKNVHSHSINQQMQPYIRHYFTSLSHSSDPSKPKIFVTTNTKYHPLHLNPHASPSSGSHLHKTLIWTKLQSLNIFRQKSAEQYYNHVEGSHILTSKQRLHEMLNGGKGWHKMFYPVSFSLPKEYNEFVQEYDWALVKGCLKFLVKEIMTFEKGVTQKTQINFTHELETQIFTVCLSDILEDLTRETKNQPQLKMLKLCLFLESGRKKQKLNTLFQNIQTYRSVDITLSESLYIDIIDWCLQLVRLSQQNNEDNLMVQNTITNTLNLSNIDYRLIQLLKAYNHLFTISLPPYLYRTLTTPENTWVIKPFAASKAAGISLILNSQQFYTTTDYEYKEYRHRAKYHNKIFMKYVENPLLIKHSGMDYFMQKWLKQLKKDMKEGDYERTVRDIGEKMERFLGLEEKFCGRKFDIRQWVLIICDEDFEGENNGEKGNQKMMSSTGYQGRKSPRGHKATKRTKFYKYHTAYCRFAQKQYTLTTSDPQVHLTNYQIYKKSLKSERKWQSPTKQHRSLNASLLQKSDYFTKPTQEKGQKVDIQERPRKRLGSISKDQRDSVLMLDELFEYFEFIEQIKNKRVSVSGNRLQSSSFPQTMRQKYESQLDMILQSLFQTCSPHVIYHKGTFQLFGVDLLMDWDLNLYLLEVNLNPGCSASRDQKLYHEAQSMVQSMFETVMGEEDALERQELKHKRIQKLQNKLIGSREYIAESQSGENDDYGQKKGQTPEQGLYKSEPKEVKKQNKWILVGEKETH